MCIFAFGEAFREPGTFFLEFGRGFARTWAAFSRFGTEFLAEFCVAPQYFDMSLAPEDFALKALLFSIFCGGYDDGF